MDVFSEEGVTVKKPGAGQAKAYQLSAFAPQPGPLRRELLPAGQARQPLRVHPLQYQSRFGLISECSADSSAALGTRCKRSFEWNIVDYPRT